MKKTIIALTTLAIIGGAWLMLSEAREPKAGASETKSGKHMMCPMMSEAGDSETKSGGCATESGKHLMCPMMLEGADVEITNIKNGVMVKITSKDPAVVKKIQEQTAKMKEHSSKPKETKEVWICTMGCYEGPKTKDGRCPKCGMNLEKKGEEKHHQEHEHK